MADAAAVYFDAHPNVSFVTNDISRDISKSWSASFTPDEMQGLTTKNNRIAAFGNPRRVVSIPASGRLIDVEERASMSGFDYGELSNTMSDSAIVKALGNSFMPNICEAIMKEAVDYVTRVIWKVSSPIYR